LRIAPSTAVDHVRKIYRKLDVHSVDALRARLRGRPPA
jgi:DNA-binding CsgD family transcriptional regulator